MTIPRVIAEYAYDLMFATRSTAEWWGITTLSHRSAIDRVRSGQVRSFFKSATDAYTRRAIHRARKIRFSRDFSSRLYDTNVIATDNRK